MIDSMTLMIVAVYGFVLAFGIVVGLSIGKIIYRGKKDEEK